ncbi:MAG: SDR family NAD(P)-dependent oxidoreductase [Candidatus Sericytochromatia bacterium]
MPKETAMITGASAGIGASFAGALARRGLDLVLVARRRAALEAIAARLTADHGVRVEVIACDLARSDATETLMAEVATRGLRIDWLINNAGFGAWGPFAEVDPARAVEMLQLNVVALTALTRALLPGMRERRRGVVINVASVAAFQGVPHFAVYAASKAYVLSFTEALAEEVRGEGIVVQALCPGTTRTEFFEVAGMPPEARSAYMSPEAVVEASLGGIARRSPVVVPGAKNRLLAIGSRLGPRRLVTRVAGRMIKP